MKFASIVSVVSLAFVISAPTVAYAQPEVTQTIVISVTGSAGVLPAM